MLKEILVWSCLLSHYFVVSTLDVDAFGQGVLENYYKTVNASGQPGMHNDLHYRCIKISLLWMILFHKIVIEIATSSVLTYLIRIFQRYAACRHTIKDFIIFMQGPCN